jgi:pimeloyl-ACP methyl ester carboxylesterase
VSQRGHGDSDKPISGYRVEDFAADVVSLLDALCIEHAVLAGHSGSCLVARRVGLERPERVAGLILEASPTTLRDDPVLRNFVASVVSRLDDPISSDFARAVVVGTSSADVPPELIDQLVKELLKVPTRVWREMFEDLLQYDDTAELGRIRAPTLLLWGSVDALVPHAMQEKLTACIPGAELIVYANISHTPRWDDPSSFSADVATFVLSHGRQPAKPT